MSKSTKEIACQFIKDVGDHVLIINHDDGIYRHLTLKNPKSNNCHFHIVTYPGYLVFSGDMGSYVFSRLHDMFDFFGGDEPNLRYWAEKVEAQDKNDGISEFSFDKFRSRVDDDVKSFLDDCKWPDDVKNELKADIVEELTLRDNHPYDCYDWTRDYEFKSGDFSFSFQDFWENNCDEFSYRYVWCCFAILFAIKKYKKVKA